MLVIAPQDYTVTNRFVVMCHVSCALRTRDLVNILDSVDPLLKKFKCREEHCVNGCRASHRHAESAVHVPSEECDLGDWHFLTFRIHQGVALVDTFD